MNLLTSTETAILNTHPDQLGLMAIAYLTDRANATFLATYEVEWASVIGPRRMR